MPRERRSAHQLDVRVAPVDAGAAAARRARASLLKLEREHRNANGSLARDLKSLTADYRKALGKLVGASGMRRLREIRSSRPKLSRSQKIRRSRAVLDDIGVDRDKIRQLQKAHSSRARDVLSVPTDVSPDRAPFDEPCESPWVTYTAPFGGYRWAYSWHRSSGPNNPALTKYLDITTGRIGSRIDTKLSDADDDENLDAEYYTGLNVWHTPLATGPLEVYLAFEFTTSDYSGKVKDEFGFSDATYSQWAIAELTASDSQNAIQTETSESLIYNFIDTDWGDGDSWTKHVARQRDLHWYYFKTAATFEQGSSLLLEGGVRQMTWFETNDESITTSADLDLRLDRIMVRSCKPELIL